MSLAYYYDLYDMTDSEIEEFEMELASQAWIAEDDINLDIGVVCDEMRE